ncbi:hypothetical protein [Photobacterium kasasachensis]|uniref:hypothetical protein n=1 Tax=Photobacterium kasasachensis TaxID=2910240 RepID=UPI003D0D7CE4
MKRILMATLISCMTSQVSAGTLHDIATTCNWELGRSDGSVISQSVALREDGTLSYKNENEHLWEVNDGEIVFRNINGAISTRFSSINIDPTTNQITLLGKVLQDPSSEIKHTLTCYK